MGQIEYYKQEGFPEFDVTRFHVVEEGIQKGELGGELRDPKYSRDRVEMFIPLIAETSVLASDLMQVPGVSFGVGDGVLPDGRTCIAFAGLNEGADGKIVFSRDYLFSHLARHEEDLTEDHQIIRQNHPVEITAHEVAHIGQQLKNPEKVVLDNLIASGDDLKWFQTESEQEARSFASDYMEKLMQAAGLSRRKRIIEFLVNSFK